MYANRGVFDGRIIPSGNLATLFRCEQFEIAYALFGIRGDTAQQYLKMIHHPGDAGLIK